MANNSARECRVRIVRGVLMLLLGSAMLLICKLPVPEVLGSIAAYAGGFVLLYGNYCIVFGLLITAGDKRS